MSTVTIQIHIHFNPYDGQVPTYEVPYVLSEEARRYVADLHQKVTTGLQTVCCPTHDQRPQMTIVLSTDEQPKVYIQGCCDGIRQETETTLQNILGPYHTRSNYYTYSNV